MDNDLSEMLFEAIDLIVEKRLKDLHFDKTVRCKIISSYGTNVDEFNDRIEDLKKMLDEKINKVEEKFNNNKITEKKMKKALQSYESWYNKEVEAAHMEYSLTNQEQKLLDMQAANDKYQENLQKIVEKFSSIDEEEFQQQMSNLQKEYHESLEVINEEEFRYSYLVTDGASNFRVFSDKEYAVNDYVNVLIPNGDYSQQKIIISRSY